MANIIIKHGVIDMTLMKPFQYMRKDKGHLSPIEGTYAVSKPDADAAPGASFQIDIQPPHSPEPQTYWAQLDERQATNNGAVLISGRLINTQNGKSIPFVLLQTKATQGAISCALWMEGQYYNLEKPGRGTKSPASSESNTFQETLNAPMPGKILDIQVEAGQVVDEGATLITMESMKMELSIKAPCRVKVEAIACSASSLVDMGQTLIRLSKVETD